MFCHRLALSNGAEESKGNFSPPCFFPLSVVVPDSRSPGDLRDFIPPPRFLVTPFFPPPRMISELFRFDRLSPKGGFLPSGRPPILFLLRIAVGFFIGYVRGVPPESNRSSFVPEGGFFGLRTVDL